MPMVATACFGYPEFFGGTFLTCGGLLCKESQRVSGNRFGNVLKFSLCSGVARMNRASTGTDSYVDGVL